VLLKAAVAWDVIGQMPCAINLVRVPKPSTGFHDFEAFEALVAAAPPDEQAYLVTLLGGEAPVFDWERS
jgi:hypothetical protein